MLRGSHSGGDRGEEVPQCRCCGLKIPQSLYGRTTKHLRFAATSHPILGSVPEDSEVLRAQFVLDAYKLSHPSMPSLEEAPEPSAPPVEESSPSCISEALISHPSEVVEFSPPPSEDPPSPPPSLAIPPPPDLPHCNLGPFPKLPPPPPPPPALPIPEPPKMPDVRGYLDGFVGKEAAVMAEKLRVSLKPRATSVAMIIWQHIRALLVAISMLDPYYDHAMSRRRDFILKYSHERRLVSSRAVSETKEDMRVIEVVARLPGQSPNTVFVGAALFISLSFVGLLSSLHTNLGFILVAFSAPCLAYVLFKNMRPNRVARLQYVPHLASCVLADFDRVPNLENSVASIRQKIRRFCTLPLPDYDTYEFITGTEDIVLKNLSTLGFQGLTLAL